MQPGFFVGNRSWARFFADGFQLTGVEPDAAATGTFVDRDGAAASEGPARHDDALAFGAVPFANGVHIKAWVFL
jgi:hypothetical protein